MSTSRFASPSSDLSLFALLTRSRKAARAALALASNVDIAEAYMVGAQAVKEAVSGKTDCMVRLVRESNDPTCGPGDSSQ